MTPDLISYNIIMSNPETANGHPALPEEERIVRMYWPCNHIPMAVFLPAIRELMGRMMVFQVGMDEPTECEKFLLTMLAHVDVGRYPATIWPKDIEEFIHQIQNAHYEAHEKNKS